MRTKNLIDSIITSTTNPVFVSFVKSFYSYVPLDYLDNFSNKQFEEFAKVNFEFVKKYNNERLVEFDYLKSEKERTIFQIIGDNKPFIVDSIKSLLSEQKINYEFFIHPVVKIERDSKNNIINFSSENIDVSIVFISIDGILPEQLADLIKQTILERLKQVDLTYSSWSKTLNYLEDAAKLVDSQNAIFSKKDIEDSKNFLEWLKNDNFTFFGTLDIDVNKKTINSLSGDTSIWGELTINDLLIKESIFNPDKIIEFGKLKKLSVTVASSFIDYVMVKEFNKDGEFIFARIFLGLYGSNLDYQSVKDIPIIREKLAYVLARSNFVPKGYNEKKIRVIIESLPRIALFHIDKDELYDLCIQTLSSMSLGNVKLFKLGECKQNFIELIIFLPRERFTPETHHKIQDYIEGKFGIKVIKDYINEVNQNFVFIYSTFYSESCDILVNTPTKDMEGDLERLTCIWEEEFVKVCKSNYDLKTALNLAQKYSDSFPNDYKYNHSPVEASIDVEKIELLNKENQIVFDFAETPKGTVLKIFSSDGKLSLSSTMPLLENLGFLVSEEESYKLLNLENYYIHIYLLEIKNHVLKFSEVEKLVEDSLYAIHYGNTFADSLSKLITYSQLSWREVDLIRALSHYMHQLGFIYDFEYVSQTLVKHSDFTKNLVELFILKFDLKNSNKEKYDSLFAKQNEYLSSVTSSAEDKILRSIIGILNAAIRTNYYQTQDGKPKNYISIKFDSSLVPGMPKPVPYAEIFVFAKDFEAIHLRGGKVARGGLRWSDRGEDYRTEVLGLMKAQMTKNAVIVPVGSKGGFFTRFSQDGISREEYMKRAINSYQNFLRGLLDITDNIVAGKIVKPIDAILLDGDDPYLVVAADKGTATFSDYANAISKEYSFWLGDAFASGGSAGYDHKKMAITARGAWISVQRHFKEIGVDVQKDEIQVVGIGDMAGDVFGNGLLLSNSVKLVAAFNHMHIFIDPSPDPKKSFLERQRLFDLPGSKWSDYNPELISKGGAIFERKAKSIKLSEEAAALLDLSSFADYSPDEVIRSILKAKIDLIWNGGIGTYVKASSEENYNIGDKSNDNLRINGNEVRAKVIGEGGNLGMSQKGRIEFARNKGRLNTDFIDNSAGVDCSDHEVNIKIAFGKALEERKISIVERDELLSKMTEQVAKLVLEDNKYQTLALTFMENSTIFTMESFIKLIDMLESEKLLHRAIEFIPSNEELIQRANNNEKLTRPELSVLLSYSKTSVYNELETSSLIKDEYFTSWLLNYFPELMRERFRDEILNHPLKKEIILTMITNRLVNQLSGPVLSSLKKETGALLCDIVRGFVIVQEIFNLSTLWDEIDDLPSSVPLEVIMEIYTDLNKVIRRGISWMITNLEHPMKISESISNYKELALSISDMLVNNLYGSAKDKYDSKYAKYIEANIPEFLAEKCAKLESLISSFDIAFISKDTKQSPAVISAAYFKIGNYYNIDWLRKTCDRLMSESYWQRLSLQSLKDDLYDKQRRLIKQAINDNMIEELDNWYKKNSARASIYENFLNSIKEDDNIDISKLILANKKLEIFIRKI